MYREKIVKRKKISIGRIYKIEKINGVAHCIISTYELVTEVDWKGKLTHRRYESNYWYYVKFVDIAMETIRKDDIVAYVILPTEIDHRIVYPKQYYDGLMLEVINEKNIEKYFNAISLFEKQALKSYYPDLVDNILEKRIEKYSDNILNSAIEEFNGFNKFEFSKLISAKISIAMRKKPGDDDSFWAHIESIYPYYSKIDLYLFSLNPNFSKCTYSDTGFYSCYSMRDDYEREYKERDEKELKFIIKKLRNFFLEQYNPIKHLEALIDKFKDEYKKEFLPPFL